LDTRILELGRGYKSRDLQRSLDLAKEVLEARDSSQRILMNLLK
jgi:hypothetical protein